MTPPLPSTRSPQPARTAVQLALQDELRSLGVNLARGAHWLVQDVGGGIARQVEPRNTDGKLHKLHELIDGAAQATFSTLQVAQHAAAAAVLPDVARRGEPAELPPLAACFADAAGRQPSRLFREVFYWLLRHELERQQAAGAAAPIARQQAIDEAYWLLLEREPALVARVRDGEANAADHAALCAAIVRAFATTRPLRDASLPPWAPGAAQAGLPRGLLTIVVAAGLVKSGDNRSPAIAEQLLLAERLVGARLALLEAALDQPDHRLADELAFIFRHA